jgi:hypothetical protein
MAEIDPSSPQFVRRRRRNTTLMVLGICMAAASMVGGFMGTSNDVLVNGLWGGIALAVCGAGLYTWTLLDRLKIG